MRVHILLAATLLLVILAASKKSPASQQQPKKTAVTFMVGLQKIKNPETLKLNLKITQQDVSLVDAIEKANEVRERLQTIFIIFCARVGESECHELTKSSEYEIEAEYYHLRGEQVFKTFTITFEMDFTVSKFDLIGVLLDEFDDIIQDNQIVIGGIQWEELSEQLSMEELIDVGVKRAKKTCHKLNMKFERIRAIQYDEEEEEEPIKEKPKSEEEGDEEQEQEEEEQEQEQEQEEQQTRYKFTAICREPKPKKPISLKSLIKEKSSQKPKKVK